MKVGDKVLVPVKVVGMSCSDTIRVEHNNCGSDFWVVDSEIQTVTAEDYRNALSEFYEMNANERSDIWGFSLLRDAFDIPAEEFVRKLRKYQSEPKTGQIWKSPTGKKIVILRVDESEVHYFTTSGFTTWSGRDYFENNFLNTGEVLTSIDAFMKDLEGLNEG